MPVHNFNSNYSVQSGVGVTPGSSPSYTSELPAGRQLSHAQGGRNPFDGSDFLAYPNHAEEFLTPAFHALDSAMKQYWAGIRVPTKDSYRFMRVKIAGGDKSLLIWADDLQEGRAKLPVASISRESHEFNPEKFSPAYHAMTSRFLSSRKNLAAKVYRPIPYLIDYKITIWAESKRDAEYILFQTLTRFNPLAEFKMFDGKLEGNVQMKLNGSSDASDKETGYDQHAKVRYEVTITAEAWLPLPEEIIPTVLGRVTNLKESVGRILLNSVSDSVGASGSAWREPIQDPS